MHGAFVTPLPLQSKRGPNAIPHGRARPAQPPSRRRRVRCRREVVTAAASPPAQRPSSPSPSSSSASSPSPQASSSGTIIVPGKFDAFHLGHRKLAAAATTLGRPTLLSFAGMAAALGWPPRPPVVAPVERSRVLREWAVDMSTTSMSSTKTMDITSATTNSQNIVDFAVLSFTEIRNMSPSEFIDYLITTRGATGIVCGPDWRFGKRRAGDVAMLREIARDRGLSVDVVEPVIHAGGVISSTRVRAALGDGDVGLATALLGRRHRVVGYVLNVVGSAVICGGFINMLPVDGTYVAVVRVIGRAEPFETDAIVNRDEEGEPVATITDARRVYCVECEIYIDFVDKVV